MFYYDFEKGKGGAKKDSLKNGSFFEAYILRKVGRIKGVCRIGLRGEDIGSLIFDNPFTEKYKPVPKRSSKINHLEKNKCDLPKS